MDTVLKEYLDKQHLFITEFFIMSEYSRTYQSV